jgi:hypothetical protein
LIQLPMIRIGGNGQLTGVVMATTASFCFKFNLVSRISLHCLYKRTQCHTLLTFILQGWEFKLYHMVYEKCVIWTEKDKITKQITFCRK